MIEMPHSSWPELTKKPKHYTLVEWRLGLADQVRMILESIATQQPIWIVSYAHTQPGCKRLVLVKKLGDGARFYSNCVATDEYWRYDLATTEVVLPDYPAPVFDPTQTWPPFGNWETEGTDRHLDTFEVDPFSVRFQYCDHHGCVTWRHVEVRRIDVKEQTIWFSGIAHGGSRATRSFGANGVNYFVSLETGEIHTEPADFLSQKLKLRNTVDK